MDGRTYVQTENLPILLDFVKKDGKENIVLGLYAWPFWGSDGAPNGQGW